jgi:hypothetical protein
MPKFLIISIIFVKTFITQTSIRQTIIMPPFIATTKISVTTIINTKPFLVLFIIFSCAQISIIIKFIIITITIIIIKIIKVIEIGAIIKTEIISDD